MWIVVGLGNPGETYKDTRHNMGFDVLDKLIVRHDIPQSGVKFHSMYGKGLLSGERVIFAKPLTYMNASGLAVQELVNFYKIDPKKKLVILSDDVDLPSGAVRIRPSGSAGGHNGLKDIIEKLGTQNFIRIRIGVGRKPKEWILTDYVLARLPKEDRALVDTAQEAAADAVECLISDGLDAAMNRYNIKPGKKKEPQDTSEKRTRPADICDTKTNPAGMAEDKKIGTSPAERGGESAIREECGS